jgi:lysozyme
MKTVIDVSEWQGTIDWEKVKPHISGAIIRCGYGSDSEKYDDAQFKRNADECTRLGIPFGVYLYSYAKTNDKAKSEAEHVLRLVKPYKLSFPVYYDLEEAGTEDGAIDRAVIFGDIIEKAGYWCGVYANLNWWNNYLKGLERFTKWVAQYNTKCDYKGKYLDIWQYSSKGSVPGIKGNVDMNYCYRDFPAEILGKAPVKKKTIAELVKEVIAGKHGNGKARIESLGDDFEEVQTEVNKLMKK